MNQETFQEVVITLLINLQSEIQATRNLFLAYAAHKDGSTPEQVEFRQKMYQQELQQIKDFNFNLVNKHLADKDVDDLLTNLFP